MAQLAGLAASFFFIILTWWVVPAIFSGAKLTDKGAPDGLPIDLWNALRESNTISGGAWLGTLERALGATAIWMNSTELLIGWFAFKVASKWQVWSNVVQIPNEIGEIDNLTFLRARRLWGANLFLRFLLGTLANVLLGICAGVVGAVTMNYVSH